MRVGSGDRQLIVFVYYLHDGPSVMLKNHLFMFPQRPGYVRGTEFRMAFTVKMQCFFPLEASFLSELRKSVVRKMKLSQPQSANVINIRSRSSSSHIQSSSYIAIGSTLSVAHDNALKLLYLNNDLLWPNGLSAEREAWLPGSHSMSPTKLR